MRLYFAAAIVLVASLFGPAAFGQIAPSPQAAARDLQGVAELQSAVSAMGGGAYNSQTNGVVAQGSLTAATGGVSGQIVWENAGAEFRYVRPGPNGPITLVSGHGNPAIVDGSKIQRNIFHIAMVTFPLHLPAVALASELNNANMSVTGIQPVTVSGQAAIKVSTVDMTDSLSAAICQQDWYFDATTFLPFRVDYLATEVNAALNTVQETTLLSDYRQVSGALIPFHIVTFFNGQQISDTFLSSVQLNASIPSSDFDPPAAVSTGSAQ